jgi:hypothetical protein
MVSPGRSIDHVVIAVGDLDRAAAQFERLGFTLAPRALHPWGTANRLAQFAGGSFIELLEVDRPALIGPHGTRTFSFGAFNRDFLREAEGMSMLVLQGNDSAGDVARFRAAGLDTYAPFEFSRKATLPDGSVAEVAFSLAFATHPDMPMAAFFTCHNRFPDVFWKPAFQRHENGAERIAEVVMAADEPERYQAFFAGLGGTSERRDGGLVVTFGSNILNVLRPADVARRVPGVSPDLSNGPRFVALVIECGAGSRELTTASARCGVAIQSRPRSSPRS